MNAIFVDRGNPKVAHELLLTKSRNVLQNKVLFKTIIDTLWYLRKVIIKSQNICIPSSVIEYFFFLIYDQC